MRKKFLIIHNRMAGRLKAPMLARVVTQLEQRGADITLKAAASIEEDQELARLGAASGAYDAVIAAGGDSTARGVAMGLMGLMGQEGLMGQDVPLGIIPAGTGNVLAQEIALGRDPQKIADVLMSGPTRSIAPGLANGVPFLLMAGVGLDAEIVNNLDHDLKQRIRKAAYVWPTLKALGARPKLLNVAFGDKKNPQNYTASFVVVTKIRHYGGSFVIAPDADLAAKDLHVVMFINTSRPGLAWSLAGAMTGQNAHVKKPIMQDGRLIANEMKNSGVIIRPCKSVRITAAEPVAMQIDGEGLGETPLEISTSDQAIRLIVPVRQD